MALRVMRIPDPGGGTARVIYEDGNPGTDEKDDEEPVKRRHDDMRCDRCGEQDDELSDTEDGSPAYGNPESKYGDVCGRCWAILSHVEGVISCASGCSCESTYPDLFEDDDEEEDEGEAIGDAEIEALKIEAGCAGDEEQIRLCDAALGGDIESRRMCARAVAAARANDEEVR